MSELKYKAGDRVRIKSIDWYNENKDEGGNVWTSGGQIPFDKCMSKWCGKVMAISHVRADHYTMVEDLVGYWSDDMIECKMEDEFKPKFKVSDRVFNKATRKWVNIIEFDIETGLYIVRYDDGIQGRSLESELYETQPSVKDTEERKVSGVCQECVFAVNDNNPHCGLRGFRNDFNVKSCSAKNNAIPNGFELQSDGYFSWVNKKKYPKTYEECAEIIAELTGSDYNPKGCMGYMSVQLTALQKLLICRAAYWKVAGDEMGLGKPWEPTKDEIAYSIYRHSNKIGTEMFLGKSVTFEFPTLEMRDAFKENFGPDIEICKELL